MEIEIVDMGSKNAYRTSSTFVAYWFHNFSEWSTYRFNYKQMEANKQ